MSDRDRILDRLRQGPLTSLQIRTEGLSGNPSQRISELRDAGHTIEAQDFRVDRRKYTRYTLQSSTVRRAESASPPLGRRAVETVAPQPPVHRAKPGVGGIPAAGPGTLFDVEGLGA